MENIREAYRWHGQPLRRGAPNKRTGKLPATLSRRSQARGGRYQSPSVQRSRHQSPRPASQQRVNDYEQVANDGFRNATSDSWMDNLYDGSVQYVGVGGVHELCPIAYSIGAGETSCENRLLSTGYGSVASDPDSSNTYCYTYFEDCDPFGETAFVPQ